MSRVERIGEATLYLGDCREIAPQLEGVDLIVTSPPYNQLEALNRPPTGTWGKSDFGRAFVEKWQSDGYKDDQPEDAYQAGQNALFAALRVACNDTASLFYNHQLRWRDGVLLHPVNWFVPGGWRARGEVVWDRCGGMMFNARMFCRFDERLLWFTASSQWKWNQHSTGFGTVWRIAREQNKEHPVAFPEKIPARCIAAVTDPGDLVLDPFMGSGTTAVAAAHLGRRFVGVEIEERWFDVACRRLEAEARQGNLFDAEADAVGSFSAAIKAIGDDVRSGAPVPTDGYFERVRK